MAYNVFRDIFHPDWTSGEVAVGKVGPDADMAELPDYKNCCVVEYVWLDSDGKTRSKCKTANAMPTSVDHVPIWMFNGAATGQASSEESDVYLVPRSLMWDPIRGAPHIMVIAEAITANMEPAFGNFRCDCAEALEKYSGHDFWFGFEQEYVLCDESGTPLSTAGGDPYCGRGASALPEHMREIMNDHYAMCLGAGIFIAGMNLEQGPAQGEFQIVGRGMTPVDQMIAARHILHKAAQKYRIAVSFEAYHPEVGHSSGLHVNVSTRQTRGDGGLTVIEKCCRALARKAEDAKKCYGAGNEDRLSGKGDTSELNTFRFAVADRGASIRIPRQVGITGKGYFEDRRPSANADPYRVAAHIVKACGDILSRIN